MRRKLHTDVHRLIRPREGAEDRRAAFVTSPGLSTDLSSALKCPVD
jgi:hypothetical protein